MGNLSQAPRLTQSQVSTAGRSYAPGGVSR